jgi:hypothetical protein
VAQSIEVAVSIPVIRSLEIFIDVILPVTLRSTQSLTEMSTRSKG